MLKIRDDVDLKELEKYGFKKEEYFYMLNYIDIEEGLDGFAVDRDSRRIYNHGSYNSNSIDVIYDLIKANLIVKE